jgi:glycogen(starch) synthase
MSSYSSNQQTKDLRALEIGMWWGTDRAGGLDRIVEQLVNWLPSAKIDVRCLVEGPNDTAFRSMGVVCPFSMEPLTKSNKLFLIRKAVNEIIKEYDPQVISNHFAQYTPALIGLSSNRPLVAHFHGPLWREAQQEGAAKSVVISKRLLETASYRLYDRIIVVSDAFAEVLVQDFGIKRNKIEVIPGAVDVARFAISTTKKQAREALGWSQSRFTLLTIRRLVQRMGLDRLVTCMKAVVAIDPNVILYIGGKGPLSDKLLLQIRELGLEHNIKMLGFIPEEKLAVVYRASDVSIMNAIALEGFGLSSVESLAAGTPSMVTPIGGLPEVVSRLSRSLIFAGTNVDDLSRGLIDVVRNTVKLPSSVECSAYAAENFSSKLMAERTAALYRNVS